MAERYTGRTLRELTRVLASHAMGMLLIVVVVLAAAAVATYFAPRVYRSEVKLKAAPAAMGSGLESRAGARDEIALFILTQREIVLSDYVLASALMRLEDPDADQNHTEQAVIDWIADNPEILAGIRDAVEVRTPSGSDAAASETFSIRVDWPETRTLVPSMISGSRKEAAKQATQLATFVKDAYLARFKQLETRRTSEAAQFLSDQALAAANTKLDNASDALSAFIKEKLKADLALVNQMQGTGAGGGVGLQTLVTDNEGEAKKATAEIDELAKTQSLLLEELTPFVPAEDLAREIMDTAARPQGAADPLAEAKAVVQAATARRALRAKPGEEIPVGQLVVPEAILKGNEGIKSMQDRSVVLSLQIAALETRYKEAYQGLADLRTELEKTLDEMIASLRRELRRTSHQLATLRARRTSLTDMVDADRAKLEELSALTADYERLRSTMETAQNLYDKELERVVSAQTAEKLARGTILVSVIDQASPAHADNPIRPIVWLNIVAALFSGVVLALIYAFVSDHFDHTIKSVDEAERYLGVPVLASVPRLGRRIIRTR